MDTENQDPTGAAGGEGDKTPPVPSGEKAPPALNVELKEGALYYEGKKMVKESDLIAAKQSLESAAEKAQTVHNEAIDASKLELSEAQQTLADTNAKLKQAQEAQGQGATTDEEVARIKQEKDEALTKVETLTTDAGKALEFKRALLVLQGFTAESLAEKTMAQLDSLEEAAKALATSRGGGLGGYAVGAGVGGAAPMTEMERARIALDTTPVRGVREPATSEQK